MLELEKIMKTSYFNTLFLIIQYQEFLEISLCEFGVLVSSKKINNILDGIAAE